MFNSSDSSSASSVYFGVRSPSRRRSLSPVSRFVRKKTQELKTQFPSYRKDQVRADVRISLRNAGQDGIEGYDPTFRTFEPKFDAAWNSSPINDTFASSSPEPDAAGLAVRGRRQNVDSSNQLDGSSGRNRSGSPSFIEIEVEYKDRNKFLESLQGWVRKGKRLSFKENDKAQTVLATATGRNHADVVTALLPHMDRDLINKHDKPMGYTPPMWAQPEQRGTASSKAIDSYIETLKAYFPFASKVDYNKTDKNKHTVWHHTNGYYGQMMEGKKRGKPWRVSQEQKDAMKTVLDRQRELQAQQQANQIQEE